MYDFSGKKWQENEYNKGGNLFSRRSYIGSFEFEGNSLQKVFHPSGFIENLNRVAKASGEGLGNITGSQIASTQKQKIEGRTEYVASKSVELLPGFESVSFFRAEIKLQSSYQWNYILRDHLNNTRILFSDKNNDGLIKQDASAVLNEVLLISNYTPFGTELGGSHQNQRQSFEYMFNGKQDNGFSGLTDYGARWLDKNLMVWRQVDPMGEKMPSWSPYSFCFDNPVKFIDKDGLYPWPVTVRSFISAQSAGGGLFYADNRGASFSGTSRVYSNFTVDPTANSISKPSFFSDPTIFYGLGAQLPFEIQTAKPTASIINEIFSAGSASFDFSHSGKDPITPSFLTPALDVHAGLTIKEDIKKGILSITGSFKGDKFPSTEAFITDQSGKIKLFLGAQMERGGIRDLVGDNKKHLFNVNMQVNFDKKGNFTGVQVGKEIYSVEQWNKKVQTDFNR